MAAAFAHHPGGIIAGAAILFVLGVFSPARATVAIEPSGGSLLFRHDEDNLAAHMALLQPFMSPARFG